MTLSATPISTAPWKKPVSPSPAVAADPDLVVETYSSIDVDVMADLILQDIGGVELSKILRYDSIDGNTTVYSPMSSVSRIKPYNSNNLLGQEFSRLVAGGSSAMNITSYMDGEVPRGVALTGEPTEYDVQVQVAIAADWVPFSSTDVEAVDVL